MYICIHVQGNVSHYLAKYHEYHVQDIYFRLFLVHPWGYFVSLEIPATAVKAWSSQDRVPRPSVHRRHPTPEVVTKNTILYDNSLLCWFVRICKNQSLMHMLVGYILVTACRYAQNPLMFVLFPVLIKLINTTSVIHVSKAKQNTFGMFCMGERPEPFDHHEFLIHVIHVFNLLNHHLVTINHH